MRSRRQHTLFAKILSATINIHTLGVSKLRQFSLIGLLGSLLGTIGKNGRLSGAIVSAHHCNRLFPRMLASNYNNIRHDLSTCEIRNWIWSTVRNCPTEFTVSISPSSGSKIERILILLVEVHVSECAIPTSFHPEDGPSEIWKADSTHCPARSSERIKSTDSQQEIMLVLFRQFSKKANTKVSIPRCLVELSEELLFFEVITRVDGKLRRPRSSTPKVDARQRASVLQED
jgi:hypothetical protein